MNKYPGGLDLILDRRSCKSYSPEIPSHEDLAAVVEAARYAPSGMNRQQCHFLVITDQDLLRKLTELVSAKVYAFAQYDFRYHAPVMVVVCHQKACTVALQDAACAMENMMLAAWSIGMGSRWVNQLWRLSDDPDLRALLTPVGLGEDEQVCCSLILGWPSQPLPERRVPAGNRITWVGPSIL